MRIILTATIAFALCWNAHNASAQTAARASLSRKACGSGFTSALVPDSIGGCQFKAACEAHDMCYGACEVGGSKFGTSYCGLNEISIARLAAKQQCDIQFYEDIAKNNGDSLVCRSLGGIYLVGVALGGQGPFNGRPAAPGLMLAIAQNSDSKEDASAKFELLAAAAQSKTIDINSIQLRDGALQFKLTKPAADAPAGQMLIIPKSLSMPELQQLGKQVAKTGGNR
jgi:hypothetical protein